MNTYYYTRAGVVIHFIMSMCARVHKCLCVCQFTFLQGTFCTNEYFHFILYQPVYVIIMSHRCFIFHPIKCTCTKKNSNLNSHEFVSSLSLSLADWLNPFPESVFDIFQQEDHH